MKSEIGAATDGWDPVLHHPDRVKILFLLGTLGAVSSNGVTRDTGLRTDELEGQLALLAEAEYITRRRSQGFASARIALTAKGAQALHVYLERIEKHLVQSAAGR